MTTLELKQWVSAKLNELRGDATAPPIPPSNMIFCDAYANYIYALVKDPQIVSKIVQPAVLMVFLMSGVPDDMKPTQAQSSAAVVPLSAVGTAVNKPSARTACEDEAKSTGDNNKDSDDAKTTPGEDTATAATPGEDMATAATPGEDTTSATESKDDGSASVVAAPATTSSSDDETKTTPESASTTTPPSTTTAPATTAASTATATPIPPQPRVYPVALLYQQATVLNSHSFCHYPSMLSITPGMTHRELYSVVRKLVQRLGPDPKEGDDEQVEAMPFKLVAVYRDSRFASLGVYLLV